MHRPLLSYSLERLDAFGVSSIALNTHHLAERLERVVEHELSEHPLETEVVISREEVLAGTAGGLKRALSVLSPSGEGSDAVVVMNGDIFFWPDLEAALRHHRRLGALATMVLREDPRAGSFGSIAVSEGAVKGILGKGKGPEAGLMFTGTHILSRAAIDSLPDEGCVVQHGYRPWLAAGRAVGAVVDANPWRDLGTLRTLHQAHLDLMEGRLRWPGRSLSPALASGLELPSDCSIERSVVGEGASLAGGTRLREAIVWPGARASGDIEASFVTRGGLVVPVEPAPQACTDASP